MTLPLLIHVKVLVVNSQLSLYLVLLLDNESDISTPLASAGIGFTF